MDRLLAHAPSTGVYPFERNDEDDDGRFAWIADPNDVEMYVWVPNACLNRRGPPPRSCAIG
jgi:hypothetical protein